MIPWAAWKPLVWVSHSVSKAPNSPHVVKQNTANLLVTDPDGVKIMLTKHLPRSWLGNSWPSAEVTTGVTWKCQDSSLLKFLVSRILFWLWIHVEPGRLLPLTVILISKEMVPRSVPRGGMSPVQWQQTHTEEFKVLIFHANAHFQETQRFESSFPPTGRLR